jgi:hypothetical protein
MDVYSEFDSTDLKVRKYIMASFLYYRLNESIMPDEDFDFLCKDLIGEFSDIDSRYFERNNITLEDLEAGTGFALKYTLRDMWGAVAWAKTVLGKDLHFEIPKNPGPIIPISQTEAEFDFL